MKTNQYTSANVVEGKRRAGRTAGRDRKAQPETLIGAAWRLPGGVRLAEYALRGGFVASSLLVRSDRGR